MRDLHHNGITKRSVAPIAVGTTGTGQTGKPVDRSGFMGVEIEFSYGSITATNAVFTPVVKEGDTTGAMTSVADADLIGTEAAAGIAATGARVSGVSKNVVKSIGYIGAKKYVSGSIKSTVTAAAVVGVNVRLGAPNNKPAQ